MTDQIISTKEEVGTYDAIETAKPGEPLFALQGGDPLAPLCVMIWAWKARKLARAMDEDDKARAALLRKASAAEEVAWAMRDYQKGGESNAAGATPPPPPSPPATYSGLVAEKHGDWLAGVVAGVRHLAEAAASFAEAADHLPPDQAASLLGAVEQIKAIGALYRPKRASYPMTPDFPTN